MSFHTRMQITDLQTKLAQAKADRVAATVRAELAERRERSIAAEREIWKHRAEEAQAAQKSAGLAR